jgi:L-lysine 2,3-aminomutase
VRDPQQLIEMLELGEQWLAPALLAAQTFPLRATNSYISRIVKGDPKDPLLLQILPLGQELCERPGDLDDPLEEASFSPVPGLIHKYTSRVLLVLSSHCAIHCRYCFRRSFPYEDHQVGREEWLNTLDYVRRSPQVNEVILSGGDPLSVSDKHMQWLVHAIADIPHVVRLRIHTR